MFFKKIFGSGSRKGVPVGILMGQTGTGKTTLKNMICGTKYQTGWSETSMTRHLFKNPNNVGKGKFELLDTPGTDSTQETYKHAMLLKHALTVSEVNTIFVIVKYDNRHGKIVENYFSVQAPVYKYENKVVVMISHWDLSVNPKEEEENIRRKLGQNCAGIIFYSQNDKPKKVADEMFSFLKKMKSDQLEIQDEEFFMTFNIYKVKINMLKDYGRYQKELIRLEGEFSKLSLTTEMSGEEKDEFIHSLIVSFKIESEKLLSNFEERYQDDMAEMDCYTSWIHFQKEIVQINDAFAKKMSRLMSYDLNDRQDPRNLVKRCPNPNCGEIWFKTEGCDGETSCGARVESFFDVLKKGWLKFEFIRKDDGSYKWVKRQMAPVEASNLCKISPNSERGNGKKSSDFKNGTFGWFKRKPVLGESKEPPQKKERGCGRDFVWSQLPKLEEEKLLELFQAKSIDEIKQRLTEDEFMKRRELYDQTIDMRIYKAPRG